MLHPRQEPLDGFRARQSMNRDMSRDLIQKLDRLYATGFLVAPDHFQELHQCPVQAFGTSGRHIFSHPSTRFDRARHYADQTQTGWHIQEYERIYQRRPKVKRGRAVSLEYSLRRFDRVGDQ